MRMIAGHILYAAAYVAVVVLAFVGLVFVGLAALVADAYDEAVTR